MGKSKRLSRSTKPPAKFIGCSLPYHIIDGLGAKAERLGLSLGSYLGELARYDFNQDVKDLEGLSELVSNLYLLRPGLLRRYCKALPAPAPRLVGEPSSEAVVIDYFAWG